MRSKGGKKVNKRNPRSLYLKDLPPHGFSTNRFLWGKRASPHPRCAGQGCGGDGPPSRPAGMVSKPHRDPVGFQPVSSSANGRRVTLREISFEQSTK